MVTHLLNAFHVNVTDTRLAVDVTSKQANVSVDITQSAKTASSVKKGMKTKKENPNEFKSCSVNLWTLKVLW